MVRHVILWKIKDEYADKKNEIRKGIKEGLEGLVGVVPGLLKVNVQTEMLESSNADVMLYSELESEEALKGYQKHPELLAGILHIPCNQNMFLLRRMHQRIL